MTPRRAELVWAVSELKKTLDDVLECLAIVLTVQRMSHWQRELDARPPIDLEAERYALGAALGANELDPLLRPDDFGEPLHRSLAAALSTGVVTDDLVHGEVVGYVRGLLRRYHVVADSTGAVLRVAALARQRRALEAVEAARRELMSPDGSHRDATAALRTALRCLDGHGCEDDDTVAGTPDSHTRELAYTFRRRGSRKAAAG